jgi:hypothetical protein
VSPYRATVRVGFCPCGSHLPAVGVKGRTNDMLNFKILDERTVRLSLFTLGMTTSQKTPEVRHHIDYDHGHR